MASTSKTSSTSILIYTPHFRPEAFRINDLADIWLQSGHRVFVVTSLPNYPLGKIYAGYKNVRTWIERNESLTIVRVPIIPRGRGGSIRLSLNYLSYLFAASIVSLILLFKKFDFIFVFQVSPVTVAVPALIVSKAKRIPCILWVQDLWPESILATGHVKSKALLAILREVTRKIYQSVDLILVQSKGFISSIENLKIDRSKIAFLPNWAESLYLKTTKKILDFKPGEPPFVITFAGNIGKAQGMHTILDAACLLKNDKTIQWHIIGEGSFKSQAEEVVAQNNLGKSVKFLGHHPITEMPTFFSESDVLLVALSDEPIFALTIPSKLQSYLASGKPILGSVGGDAAALILDSQSGLVSPPGNASQLVENILKFKSMTSEELAAFGTRGKSYFVEHFTREIVIENLSKHIQSIKGKHQ